MRSAPLVVCRRNRQGVKSPNLHVHHAPSTSSDACPIFSFTYSSASCPSDFFTLFACSRKSFNFAGSIVVVIRIRLGKPSLGLPILRSLDSIRRQPTRIPVENFRHRHAVPEKHLTRTRGDRRLHAYPSFGSDRGTPGARRHRRTIVFLGPTGHIFFRRLPVWLTPTTPPRSGCFTSGIATQ